MVELTKAVLARIDAAQRVALLRPPTVADPIRRRELVREATRGLRFWSDDPGHVPLSSGASARYRPLTA